MRGGQHLYVFQADTTGAFKVGRSSNPERRLHDLQVGCPYTIRILLVAENEGHRERRIHDRLRKFRSQGTMKGEWFHEEGLASLPIDLYEQIDLEACAHPE